MRVVHNIGKKSIEKEVEDSRLSFLMSNKSGGFMYLPVAEPFSKYNGLFFPFLTNEGFDYFKTIETIGKENEHPVGVTNNIYSVKRNYAKGYDEFFMNHSNTVLYEASEFDGNIQVVFDSRMINDYTDKGRIYHITQEDGKIIVEYVKYKTDNLKEVQYRLFTVIAGSEKYFKECKWLPRDYSYDNERESFPKRQYVFDALRIPAGKKCKLVITYSETKEEALNLSRKAVENYDYLKRSIKNYGISVSSPELKLETSEKEVAYTAALNSLNYLHNTLDSTSGIFAGYPWFYQFWTRDEAISVGALISQGYYSEAKSILFRHLEHLLPDGRIPNRYPHSMLASADGVGWVFKRIFDLFETIEHSNCFSDYVSGDDLLMVKRKLRFVLNHLLKNHTEDGLAKNLEKETWMDTDFDTDTRAGFRIEIQALRLNMYRFMRYLCLITKNRYKYNLYKSLEVLTRRKVREHFWNGKYLDDGFQDPTVRPNLFLAYYIYPKLLSKDQWRDCFDEALDKLWMEWGGLSSIDKRSSLFSPEYTGENNRSYHRGDSWYFVNNIAAVCMKDLDALKYQGYIEKIEEASVEDLLFKGAIGHSSEISSASFQSPQGCLSQAWSVATLIELLRK